MHYFLIPTQGYPEFISDSDDQKLMHSVFGTNPVTLSIFNSYIYYYFLSDQQSRKYPINPFATFIKRLTSNQYTLTNVIIGDVLLFFPESTNPRMYSSFIDQALLYYETYPKITEKNRTNTYL